MSDHAARAELDGYFDRIEHHLPRWAARFLQWLRLPAMLPARIVVSVLLFIGGLLAFLPILGFWMLPLGLIIIAQDLPFLQRPLVRSFRWAERMWQRWRGEAPR